jgi:hypothetical protein
MGDSLIYGFSQLSTQSVRNINHPLCGCEVKVIQRNHLPIYNQGVQAKIRKGR